MIVVWRGLLEVYLSVGGGNWVTVIFMPTKNWREMLRTRGEFDLDRNAVTLKLCHMIYCRPGSEASEGYVFTDMCHSYCPVEGVWHQMDHGIGHLPPPFPIRPGTFYPPSPKEVREPGNTVNGRAVRILLEFILVFNCVFLSSFSYTVSLTKYW